MLNELMTAAGENLKDTPWQVYPRPQMKRESYLSLNGAWDFDVNSEKQGQIRVPFCPESNLSGIGVHFAEGAMLTYRRMFILPEGFNRGRVILHVGAADQVAEVFVNGESAGVRILPPYVFDVSNLKPGSNEITVIVSNHSGHRERDGFSQYLHFEPSGLLGPVVLKKEEK